MTCPCFPKRFTSGPYSFSGSAMIIESSVSRNTLTISRLVLKDLPLPGVPRNNPLGFFSSLRFAIIRFEEMALRP